jgi:hypothetical protein
MLRSYMTAACVSAAALGLVASVNCGGGTDTNTGGGGSATTSTTSSTNTGGSPGTSLVPPGPPGMKAPDGTGSVTFAVSKLYLGDTNPDGTPNVANGWKKFGYDLDGKVSTLSSTDLCKPRNNAAPKNVYPDGDNGIDNSFGKNILPVILGLQNDASAKINEGIAGGSFTIMMDMDKLGAGAEYNPLLVRLYAGGDLGASPKFDGTDAWPVRPELLNDPNDIKSAKIQFPNSYVVNNTWVSGTKGTVNLGLSISGFTLNLTIASAYITMEMDASHKHGTKGVIAGVLNADTLVGELQKVAGSFDPTFCDPTNATFQSIATQILQASDILSDGTQDPTKQCDGISIGLGFDAELVTLGAVLPVGNPPPDPCAPTP